MASRFHIVSTFQQLVRQSPQCQADDHLNSLKPPGLPGCSRKPAHWRAWLEGRQLAHKWFLLTMTAVVEKCRANPSGSHWGHFMGMLVQIQSLAILWHYISSHGHSTRVPRGIAETLNLPMQSLYCCHLLAFNHPYMLPHVLIPIYLDIIASVWFSWSVLNHLITNWFVQAGDQWKYHCELNCPDDLWQLFLLPFEIIFFAFPFNHGTMANMEVHYDVIYIYVALPCEQKVETLLFICFVLFTPFWFIHVVFIQAWAMMNKFVYGFGLSFMALHELICS